MTVRDIGAAVDAVAVTPSDTTDLRAGCRSLYIGGPGNAVITLEQQGAAVNVTFTGLVAGSVLPVRAKRVWSTNTTATGIVALY